MINFLSPYFLWTKRVNNLNFFLTQLFDVMALLCSVLSVFYFQAVQRHTTLVLTTWTLGAMSTSIRPITITAMTSQLVHNISSVTTVGDICIVCTPHKKNTDIFLKKNYAQLFKAFIQRKKMSQLGFNKNKLQITKTDLFYFCLLPTVILRTVNCDDINYDD